MKSLLCIFAVRVLTFSAIVSAGAALIASRANAARCVSVFAPLL